jgi:putative flippase GtrA
LNRHIDSAATHHQVARFLIVGLSNTLLSYAIFLLLAEWMNESVAYTIAFALGLAYTTTFTTTWVFRGDHSAKKTALFLGWYILIWLIGVGLVHAIGHGGFRRHLLAAAVVLAITTPLNFIGGRFILTRAAELEHSRL